MLQKESCAAGSQAIGILCGKRLPRGVSADRRNAVRRTKEMPEASQPCGPDARVIRLRNRQNDTEELPQKSKPFHKKSAKIGRL